MWPFKRKPPPTRYAPIDYQVGDKVVCLNDNPHNYTHQKLLTKGGIYEVTKIDVGKPNPNGFGGPFVHLAGVMLAQSSSAWGGMRFRKVLSVTKKQDITEQVMQPAFTPTEVVRERAEAEEVWG